VVLVASLARVDGTPRVCQKKKDHQSANPRDFTSKKYCRIDGFAKESADLPSLYTWARDTTKAMNTEESERTVLALASPFLKARITHCAFVYISPATDLTGCKNEKSERYERKYYFRCPQTVSLTYRCTQCNRTSIFPILPARWRSYSSTTVTVEILHVQYRPQWRGNGQQCRISS